METKPENLYETIGEKLLQQNKNRFYQIKEKIPRWLFPVLEILLG